MRDDEDSLFWAHGILKSSSNPVNSTLFPVNAMQRLRCSNESLVILHYWMWLQECSENLFQTKGPACAKGRDQKRPVTHRELQLVLCKWIEGSKRGVTWEGI